MFAPVSGTGRMARPRGRNESAPILQKTPHRYWPNAANCEFSALGGGESENASHAEVAIGTNIMHRLGADQRHVSIVAYAAALRANAEMANVVGFHFRSSVFSRGFSPAQPMSRTHGVGVKRESAIVYATRIAATAARTARIRAIATRTTPSRAASRAIWRAVRLASVRMSGTVRPNR